MARRDVDLVIRARDEAAKTVDTITKALNDFYDGTKRLDQGAEKSESALTQLGAAIAKMDKAINDASGTERLARDLDKASSALARLESRFESTQQEATQQGQALARNTQLLDRYTAKLNGATAALDRQKGAVAAARKDQKGLAAAQNEAATAVERLSAKQAKLPGQIERQTAAVTKAKARYAELSDIIAGTAQPTATLVRQFEASGRSVTEKTQKLARLQGELNDVTSDLRAAGSALALFSQQSDRAATNLTRQERALSQIEQNYAGLRTQVQASAGVQSRLQSSVDKTNASLQRQGAEIEKAEASYVDLAQSAGRADAAIEQFASSSLQKLSAEMRDQRKATLEAKREWNLAQANVKELAQAMEQVRRPSEQLNRSFTQARDRARLAKTEYQLNAQALNRMGQAYQSAGRDVQSLQAASNRIAGQQARLAQELGKVADRSQRVAAQTGRTDAAMRTHAGTVSRLSAAYRQFYGDSRQSLSLLQRIRGEVLSLAAAYGGLFAAIEVIRQAVQATETLAGVSSRLNVAFGGNEIQAGEELDFIRRQADRLGVSFVNLSTEYSKFAVATKNTNLEGQATRDIFIGIAEAARVNRASQADLQGVFTALTQIVSKGAVQMEELRQQLGDRLPGAVQLMADSLGITTAELIKMTEQGQLTSEALIPFANEVRERFGPGLEEAVGSTAASLGRLQNAAFKALTVFSAGGFDRGFQNFIDTVTEVLNSADFEDFARRAGAAMGKFFDILAFGAENFDVLLAAMTAFAAFKLTPIVLAIGSAFLGLGRTVVGAATGLTTLTASAGASTAAVGGLRVALTALLSSTGIGLLVAAVGAGIALWATNASQATEALNQHKTIVDQVRNAYDNVTTSVDEWRAGIDRVTESEARANLLRLENAMADLQRRAELLGQGNNSFWTNFFGYNLSARQEIFNVSDRYLQDIQTVFDQFNNGQIAADGLVPALDAVNSKYAEGGEEAIEFGEAVIQLGRELIDMTTSTEEARDIIEALTNENGEAQESFDDLGRSAEDAGEDIDDAKDNADKFNDAMQKMGELIPSVKKEMEFQAAVAELEAVFAAALKAASGIDEMAAAAKRFEAAKAALETGNLSASNFEAQFVAEAARGAGSGNEELVRATVALAEQMGVAAEDLLTVFSYETGGSLSPSQLGPTTQWGQHFGLIQFGRPQGRRYGVTPQSSVTEQVVAAGRYLEDAGIRAGDGLLRIYAAINAGDPDKIYASDANNGGAPGTVLDKVNDQMDGHRARAQGLLAAYGGVARESEELVRTNERNAEITARQQERTQQRLADTQFELDQQRLKNEGLNEQAAVEAALRQARAENPDITQEQLDIIARQTAETFRLADAKRQTTQATKDQSAAERDAMQLVTQLEQKRNALEEQRQIALENGDTTRAQELKTEIEAVNQELLQAIDNAIAMWEAVGGPKAEAAIAKLQTARIEAQGFGNEAGRSFLQWDRVGDLFINGLTNAFDQFAQAVANGEDAGEAARRAFLQFASDFLREIATMIIKQAILNALRAAFGGTPFGAVIGIGAGHTGGLVGSSRVGSGNQTRQVNPAVFYGAMRYHEGGMIGLRPGEVPIIAKKGEEMLTEDDPRHMLNGGGKGGKGSGGKQGMNIINAFDSPSFLESALADSRGSEVFMNFVQANRDSFVSMLEG